MPTTFTAVPSFNVLTLILQIATILIVARLVGALFRRMGQPQVVGEMTAGILLGPSVFGAIAPSVSAYVFPVESLNYLNAISQVGLLLFMFMIGLEMDARLLRGSTRVALTTSYSSIVIPFLLGVGLAFVIFQVTPPPAKVRFTGYALFMGTALSITAFPVLASILREKNLGKTRVGTIAMAAAAVNDVTAWCVLAIVIAIVRANEPGLSLFFTIGGAVVFSAVMVFIVRPVLAKVIGRRQHNEVISQDLVAGLLIFALACAWITERIGVHALFGAFLAGAIFPAHFAFVETMIEKLEDVTVVFLLPLFFAFTGLRTHLDLLASPDMWWKTAAVIVIAVAGKLGGSAIVARWSGMSWREAGAVGALMNTRGLMELVVLNIGLDIGVIPPSLFAMMVLMAVVTTLMTTPLLDLFQAR